MHNYEAFKLLICSEIILPELPLAAESQLNKEHINIKFGVVDASGLNCSATKGLFYQATESELWLHVPNIARFLVSNGNQIIIDAVPGIDEESIRVFILGSCMGALLMQRNLFLLHGNAVKIGEHCISFVGHSGAGKSTLCGAFFKRGYSILADDVCAIDANGFVLPSFPQIKLWFDAAQHLNIETKSLRKIRPRIEKFAVPLDQQFHTETLPLKIVYVLNPHNKSEFNLETIKGVQKLQPMQNNAYRKHYIKGLEREKGHFLQSANIANKVAVVRVTRPNEGFDLDQLVTLIEQDMASKVLSNG
jgi:hypothetical protein